MSRKIESTSTKERAKSMNNESRETIQHNQNQILKEKFKFREREIKRMSYIPKIANRSYRRIHTNLHKELQKDLHKSLLKKLDKELHKELHNFWGVKDKNI